MRTFDLKIAAPDGLFFDGEAEKVIVRAVMGDLCVLAGHADLVSPIDEGNARITLGNGDTRIIRCKGGFISVKRGAVRIVSDSISSVLD